MPFSILTVAVRQEADIVTARQRSRQVARLLGFDGQDQTRIATAVSEIARNAFEYGQGGKVTFTLEGQTSPQLLLIEVSDKGPGIGDVDRILEGRYRSSTGMGVGITGARRLVDQFEIQSSPGGGTTVVLKKVLPRRTPFQGPAEVVKLTEALAEPGGGSVMSELQQQNQELLGTLNELRQRQQELSTLNHELENTNRGVVALYAELDERADHLRQADALKSRFLSNMSHEFRSPLNSIMALAGLLADGADGPLNSEQAQQVAFIRKAAQDLYDLVNDLLDLAKVEAGKVDVKPLHFRVSNLFGALRGMLRPLFINQSVRLVFDNADELPEIYSDEGKISQILRNFISNALKFTEKGEVRISASVVGDCLRVDVRDSGIGIAPEHQATIFDEFAQVDNPIQRRVKGTGLGLPLSRRLATLLQGRIWVESEMGIGSVFTLEIPLEFKPEPLPEPMTLEEGEGGGMPVLVVEDRPEIALAYSKWLRDSGFHMIHAASTRAAFAKVQSAKPVAVILDILLQGEDSWSFLASFKGAPETRNVPVLVVSSVDDRPKAFQLGADEYLNQPVNAEDLLFNLRRLTSGRNRRVLIIDDSEQDRYILRRQLQREHLEILEASSGTEGIARAIETTPDLIVLDLTMPGASGFEVLEMLKADPRTRPITVVINTSLQLNDEQRNRLSKGAAAVMTKDQWSRPGAVDFLTSQMGN